MRSIPDTMITLGADDGCEVNFNLLFLKYFGERMGLMHGSHEIRMRSLEEMDGKEAGICEFSSAEDDSGGRRCEAEDIGSILRMEDEDGSDAFSQAALKITESLHLHQRLLDWGVESLRRKADPMGNILIWLRVRRFRFSMSAVEVLEGFLKLGSERMLESLSREEERCLVCVLQEIGMHITENILGCNRGSIRMFLFRIFLRTSRAADTTKMFAFELYIRAASSAQYEEFEGMVHGIDALDTFDIGETNFRDHAILHIYRHVVFQGSGIIKENHERFVDVLSERLFSDSAGGVPGTTASLLSCTTSYSRILCVSLALRYLRGFEKGRRDLDFKFLGLLLERVVAVSKKSEYTEEEMLYFAVIFKSSRPAVPISKVIKSFVLLLLRIVGGKERKPRIKAAKILCGIQLYGILIGRKVLFRILRTARKHIQEKRVTIVRGAVNVVAQLDLGVLAAEMQKPHSIRTRRIIFDRVKNSFQTEACYRTYIDLLSSRDTRDVEYYVEDIGLLAKVLHSYEDKSICRFMRIDIPFIEDAFVAELAALYSKFHPGSVDEVYAASVLLDSGDEIVKSRNVPFYNSILEVLMNLSSRLSFELRRRLAMFLRRLVFYSPYTRNAGMLINLLGYKETEFPRRTDYFVAILGSCGSPYIRDYFSEYPWTANKELGLVYNLRFDPDFGMAYKWKLEEILSRMHGGLDGKEAMVCAELLSFLKESVELSATARAHGLAFKLVANNCDFIICGAKSGNIRIRREACALLKRATKAGAILPHVSIPVIFSYYLVSPEMVRTYFDATLCVIREVIENKKMIFRDKKQILEFRTVYDIYVNSECRLRLVEKLLEVLDECPVKTYYLMVQAAKFERKDFARVVRGICSTAHTYNADDNGLLLKLHTLFSSLYASSKAKKEVRISDESILFSERATPSDIDMLRLCPAK
uniref:Uncharacterized protein n=1 Tax=Encephalitozoon cuniculi TaxID=6035 RepID=M1JLE6_ENCCN|nr:hypothetical protein ECU07_0230 [Encephalitozoon cuniculi]